MDARAKIEIRRLLAAAVIPTFFMVLCWMMFAAERLLDVSFSQYGLMPREISHWFGVFTMPFLHANLSHIFSNSVSFIVLGTMLFYFYPEKALRVFLISYIFTGILTWIIGIGGVHIGASGMIYAFAAYIFTVGARSGNIQNMALSLIVVFLYGSMVWGLVCAFIYPIKKVVHDFDDEDDDDYDTTFEGSDIEIKYHYTSGKEKNE